MSSPCYTILDKNMNNKETMRQHHRVNKGIRRVLHRIINTILKLHKSKQVAPAGGLITNGNENTVQLAWTSADNLFLYFRIVDNYYYELVQFKVIVYIVRLYY